MARIQRKTPEQRREKRQKREKKMRDMGVKKARHLSYIPLLLAAMVVLVWLKLPSYATYEFSPAPLTQGVPASGVAVSAEIEPMQAQGAQLVYAQLTWRELENAQGEYDFEAFERKNHIDQWREMGVGVILNFCMDVPGDAPHSDLPDWLYEAMEADGVTYDGDGGMGFSPDYANSLLRESYHAVIAALGERYNDDPAIAVVEVGSIGANGMWILPEGQELPAASVLTGYAQQYVNAFPDKPLTCAVRYAEFAEMGIGCLNSDVSDVEGSWHWINQNLYGGYDARIRQEIPAADPARTGGAWSAHILGNVKLSEMTPAAYEGLLQRLREGNASYLYGADVRGLSEDRQLMLNNALGATLWVRRVQMPMQIRANHRLRLNMTWQNDGSSALLCDWPLEIALYREGEMVFSGAAEMDAGSLLPGRTETYAAIDLPYDLPDGEYDVAVGIVCPEDISRTVPLAMDCERIDGRCIIGKLRVH